MKREFDLPLTLGQLAADVNGFCPPDKQNLQVLGITTSPKESEGYLGIFRDHQKTTGNFNQFCLVSENQMEYLQAAKIPLLVPSPFEALQAIERRIGDAFGLRRPLWVLSAPHALKLFAELVGEIKPETLRIDRFHRHKRQYFFPSLQSQIICWSAENSNGIRRFISVQGGALVDRGSRTFKNYEVTPLGLGQGIQFGEKLFFTYCRSKQGFLFLDEGKPISTCFRYFFKKSIPLRVHR